MSDSYEPSTSEKFNRIVYAAAVTTLGTLGAVAVVAVVYVLGKGIKALFAEPPKK